MGRIKNKPKDPIAENHEHVVKAGVYDGRHPAKDFVVSGHSTGNPDSEMEKMSHQVSIDAGRVPGYPTDQNYEQRGLETSIGVGSQRLEQPGEQKDLGGPMLYGPNPDLGDSPLNPTEPDPNLKRDDH